MLVFGRFLFLPVCSCGGASGADVDGGGGSAWEDDACDECHVLVFTDCSVFLNAAASRWRLDIVLNSDDVVAE